MKEFILKNFKRLWFSALVGFGFGFVIEIIAGFWRDVPVNSWLMIVLIIGAAIGAWFVFTNNNDFKKK